VVTGDPLKGRAGREEIGEGKVKMEAYRKERRGHIGGRFVILCQTRHSINLR
jgi:hypothetical protein